MVMLFINTHCPESVVKVYNLNTHCPESQDGRESRCDVVNSVQPESQDGDVVYKLTAPESRW